MPINDVIKIIKNSTSVAIIPHISADGDAIASCKAMAEVLNIMGKKWVIYSEEPVEKRLQFMDDGITVYDGMHGNHDLCIVLDCGDLDRVGKRLPILKSADRVINIDHHKTNTMFGDANLVVDTACATGEILVSLFEKMDIDFNETIARYLYTAICSDSGCFQYSNVSADTMRLTAKLLDTGFDHSEITHLLYDECPLDVALMKAEVTCNIHSYVDGRLMVVLADESLAKKYNLNNDEVQGLVEIPRKIQGTEIAVAIKDLDGKITASFRSNSNIDVAEISMEFGGGGHAKAAGCRLDAKNIQEAENMVVEACKKALSKNKNA